MNGYSHHDHDDEHHVNGTPASPNQVAEAELDAYEQRLTHEAVVDQVKTFFAAQEVRVTLYHGFESAFQQHFAGEKSNAEIARVIANTTSSLNDISRRINRCEEALRDDLNRGDLAEMIRRIQECERAKFEATVKTQMWKTQEGERDYSEDIRDAGRVREEAIATINEVMDDIRAEVY